MTSHVRVGQIWRSTDPRDKSPEGGWPTGRDQLEVIAIPPERFPTAMRSPYAIVRNRITGRESEILLSRLKPGPRGYELVSNP